MPIKIPDGLPAFEILNRENVFVMPDTRAFHQDIRPLKILILNLMPTKETTETQLLRLLGNTPLQIDINFLYPVTHTVKNTAQEHLDAFYKTFADVQADKFDGMIITGAPIEHLDFTDVFYWRELQRIMDWSVDNVTSTLHICWGAQAGLFHHYGIEKYPLPAKVFGVFSHYIHNDIVNTLLIRGFDDEFYVPHSRHTEVKAADIKMVAELEIVAESKEAGVYLVASKNRQQVFVTGHSEYDLLTLKSEYERDLAKSLPINMPKNYFPGDDTAVAPRQKWRSHANLLFANWLNYYVYQETPYNLADLSPRRQNTMLDARGAMFE